MNLLKPLLLVALPALLCACGSKSPAGGSAQSHARAAKGSQPPAADPDMVTAVGPAEAPIGLKFRLETRPVVGMPAQLVLAMYPTPGVEISHIHGSLQAAEGLQLQSTHSFDIDAPQGAGPLEQDVTVVPQRIGVLSLSAVLEIDYDNQSIARTYFIPLIAANNAS